MPWDYFGRLASESGSNLRDFLSRLAEGHATHFEINISKYQPSLSENFLGIQLGSSARFLVGIRDRSQPIRPLPPWVTASLPSGELNSGGGLDGGRWICSSWVGKRDRRSQPAAGSPREQIAAARIFFTSNPCHGLAYFPAAIACGIFTRMEATCPGPGPCASAPGGFGTFCGGHEVRRRMMLDDLLEWTWRRRACPARHMVENLPDPEQYIRRVEPHGDVAFGTAVTQVMDLAVALRRSGDNEEAIRCLQAERYPHFRYVGGWTSVRGHRDVSRCSIRQIRGLRRVNHFPAT